MAYLAHAYQELPSWFSDLNYHLQKLPERSGTKLVVDRFAVDKQGFLPNQTEMKFFVAGFVVDKQDHKSY
ncbi:hypothetical protein OUZ56_031515 [Daphnia magna]|uniref:Uncharacterized protein n=1 Tax=Daphnia magna TaxID=35525 RepID=A0ABQ9ZUG6_9CRUS|nr:hypothetical protein OUZ56_031515 [Daphnia magna]